MQRPPVGIGEICMEVVGARGHRWSLAASASLSLRWCWECEGRRHKPCSQGTARLQGQWCGWWLERSLTGALAGASPGCYGDRVWGVRVQKEGHDMLPGRDEADLSLAGWERGVWERKSRRNFPGCVCGDLSMQMYQGTWGHFDKCLLCLVFHSMHSLLLREAFLQLYNTVRCGHYWMSNALNKFYYFMLDVWSYPLISDSYYPKTKWTWVNIFFSLKK